MQRNIVVESDSTISATEDSEDAQGILKGLNNTEPMVRVFALAKIYRILKKYEGSKLTDVDQRLLKGFYISDKWEISSGDEEIFDNADPGIQVTLKMLED